jgi:hypothetical protein
MAACDGYSDKRYAAEREKKASLHTVDLRHHPDRRVVNNLDGFCLPVTGAPVISASTSNQGDIEMIKSAAVLFGVVFLLVGILGFVPGVAPDQLLFKIFHVNAAHNIVHIGSGIIFLIAAMAGAGASTAWFKIFGIIYAVVAIWGFTVGTGNTLWVVSNNPAVTYLHVVLAAVMLFLGYGTCGSKAAV